MLDSESLAAPSALYARVVEAVTAEVRTGSLRPGDRLPGERDLADRFGVSRVTVRRALADLSAAGLIESHPGRGTYVSDRVGEPADALMSFSELGAARGLVASARVLRSEVRPSSMDEAGLLGIAPGAPLFELERVRLLDRLPVSIDTTRVPLARAPGLETVDFTSTSLYRVLEDHGCAPARADYTLHAVAADARQAALLDVDAGFPLLQTATISSDAAGRTVEAGDMVYRGDRYRFRASLTRRTTRA